MTLLGMIIHDTGKHETGPPKELRLVVGVCAIRSICGLLYLFKHKYEYIYII